MLPEPQALQLPLHKPKIQGGWRVGAQSQCCGEWQPLQRATTAPSSVPSLSRLKLSSTTLASFWVCRRLELQCSSTGWEGLGNVMLKTEGRGQYQPGNLEALPAHFRARHPHAKMEYNKFCLASWGREGVRLSGNVSSSDCPWHTMTEHPDTHTLPWSP